VPSSEFQLVQAFSRKLVEIAEEIESLAQEGQEERARDRIVKAWMVLSRIDKVLVEWHSRLFGSGEGNEN
jgi:uncharacterized NAD(P)/FAD-binding protein YdhS